MNESLSNEQSEVVANTDSPDLMKQIREDYRWYLNYWRKIRDEAATDMRFVAGDPWNPDDRANREAAGRPCLTPDEISQYIKQANNNLRQNKRAVQVNPKGSGATDKDAERRASIIRGWEYQSNAQAAYTTAFEQCTESGFGFYRINNEYIDSKTDEVEPRIKRIPNQFTVLVDPMAKEADRSDMMGCFVTDKIRKEEFQRRWPKAKHKSFGADEMTSASDWFLGDYIVIAEYWKREKINLRKIRNRETNDYKVTQYITNGIEILEENPWPGSWIPIIGVYGEEMYLVNGGQSELVMYSMIRRARSAQMMMCYIASAEAEEFGQAPKAPFVGAVGQFESDKDAWTYLNKVPKAYVQYDPVVDESGNVFPPPARPQFTPNVQMYEVAQESWRRHVQASMGQVSLPTAAQRRNEKSGVALQTIQTETAIGNYNFTDNYDRALMNGGRQLNELITKVVDTPRYVSARKKDDTHTLLAVMQQKHLDDGQLPEGIQPDDDYLITDRGEFDVTISTGPSFQSQRENADAFVDLLIQNIESLPISPPQKALLLSKAIKLKNLGPIGDDIADILDPQADQPIPPQAQAAIGQLQQHMQGLMALNQEYQAQIGQLKFAEAAKIADNTSKERIERMKIEAQITQSEITTKAQSISERLDFVHDMLTKLVDNRHDAHLQMMDQAHETALGQQQGQQQQDLAAQNNDAASQQQATQLAAQPQAPSGETGS